MSTPPRLPGRSDVTAILAQLGDRSTDQVGEAIGSLELTWLITKVEQEYQVSLDLSDAALGRMATVAGAVAELRAELGEEGHA